MSRVLTLNRNVLINNSNAILAPDSSSAVYQDKVNITPTTSSQTIFADVGYDALNSVQINAVSTGTAGTPIATKGTVSNHSVSITPSVTNTTGYIVGSTEVGTAVTVTASELISFSTIRTGSDAPSSSLGVDGDIYIQTS